MVQDAASCTFVWIYFLSENSLEAQISVTEIQICLIQQYTCTLI